MTVVSFSKGLGALNAITQIQRSEDLRTNSIAKISSSLKIRKAADSVADSAIGTKIKVEIDSLKQILVGTAQAQSALNIAEGALNELTNTIMRMSTLAKQSVNGSNSDDDREKINLEYKEIMKEVDRISDAANFNSKKILSGTKTIINDKYDAIRQDFLGKGGLDDFGNYKKGGGFDAIVLDPESDSFDYQITYNKDTQMMKVADKATGKAEEVKLSRDTIGESQTEKVAFTKMNLKITLNNYFNKNASIGAEYAESEGDNNYKLVNQISSAISESNTKTVKQVVVTGGKVTVGTAGADNLTFNGKADIGTELTGAYTEFKNLLGTITTNGAGEATFAGAIGNSIVINGEPITSTVQNSADANNSVTGLKITSVDDAGNATFEAKIKFSDGAGTDDEQVITGTMQLKTEDKEVINVPQILDISDGKVTVTPDNAAVTGTFKLSGSDLKNKITDQTRVNEFKAVLGAFGGGANGTLGDVTFGNAGKGVIIDKTTQINFSVDDTKSFVENFKILSIDGKTGKAQFRAKVHVSNADESKQASIKITGTLDLKTKAVDDPLDRADNLIIYNRNGMVTDDGKTYNLADGEYVSNTGHVKNIFGENVEDIKVALKEVGIDANNYKIFVSGGSGIAGDITDLGIYMEGTNSAAKFVMHGIDGDFVSEGTYDLTDLNSVLKNKAGTLELKQGLNEITLSRQVRKTEQGDLPREKDVIKVSIILGKDLNTISQANATKSISEEGGFLHGVGVKNDDGTVNDKRFAVLNELKNSKLFYQEKQDTAEFNFQVGTGSTQENIIKLKIKATTAQAMNISQTDVLTVENANEASKKLQAAMDYVQEQRTKVGVTDNRIGFANNNINTTITNSQSAAAAIFDLDVPSEITELSQTEMKQSASIESLSRDMRSKQGLLKLFS